MQDRELDCIAPDCIAEDAAAARPLRAVRPEALPTLLDSLPPAQAGFVRDAGFAAAAGSVILLPGAEGVEGGLLGLGDAQGPHVWGSLPFALPRDSVWRLEGMEGDAAEAVLGFCLGAYRFDGHKTPGRAPARLVAPGGSAMALETARAAWMVRDLINTPANLLGPAELAAAAQAVAQRGGGACTIAEGDALARDYPTVAAVGAGSARKPRVATIRWQGSKAGPDAPLVALCGKGVCFDSGGYDLKPPAGMLRMKKDMGGAAITLGLARLIMASDLPVRLAARIGCVENSVSGEAMRPLDVVRTRRGLTVEIGNTDAEGRLVLCDLLAEASDEDPALVVDFATLTGAARVAVGPDLAALFCNDEGWAGTLLDSGLAVHDPLWRLPLWAGYESWLASPVADLNNVSSKAMAGAVVAALFMQRFLAPGARWAHFDVYAWNDAGRPGKPEGGEAQAMRAVLAALASRFADRT